MARLDASRSKFQPLLYSMADAATMERRSIAPRLAAVLPPVRVLFPGRPRLFVLLVPIEANTPQNMQEVAANAGQDAEEKHRRQTAAKEDRPVFEEQSFGQGQHGETTGRDDRDDQRRVDSFAAPILLADLAAHLAA